MWVGQGVRVRIGTERVECHMGARCAVSVPGPVCDPLRAEPLQIRHIDPGAWDHEPRNRTYCSSSRTFPIHLRCSSRASAPEVNWSSASLKCRISSGMSLRRAESGGTTSRMPKSRWKRSGWNRPSAIIRRRSLLVAASTRAWKGTSRSAPRGKTVRDESARRSFGWIRRDPRRRAAPMHCRPSTGPTISSVPAASGRRESMAHRRRHWSMVFVNRQHRNHPRHLRGPREWVRRARGCNRQRRAAPDHCRPSRGLRRPPSERRRVRTRG